MPSAGSKSGNPSNERDTAPRYADSRRITAQRALAHAIQNSPRVAAQRERREQLLGSSGKAGASAAGLPAQLKAGIESLSGLAMDQVRVHYNSDKPQQLQALAYAQGSDIHLAPGQERHLPHEAWHVVQQAQGRVRAGRQMAGTAINEDAGLESEADRMGALAAAHGQSAPPQREPDDRGDGPAQRVAAQSSAAPVQRQVRLDDASELQSWETDVLDGGSEELEDLFAELEDDFDWSKSNQNALRELIEAPALYGFRDYDHMADYIGGNTADPPELEEDEGTAMVMDDFAKDFGSAFKGKHIPFSGSRVFAVGKPGTIDDDVWATQNSATGRVGAKQQAVVKNWALDTPAKLFLDRLSFPSNTKAAMTKAHLKRPDVMAANAHAEVNQYVHLALLSATHGLNPSDVGLAIGSDIAHCAECYWALNAMAAKGVGKFTSLTGCQNKLFARWREPWSGFYATFGPNPFRKDNGKFRQNPLTHHDFDAGSYSAAELNNVSPFKVYS